MKTIRTIAAMVVLLFGFNFYLNHFYTKFDERINNAEQTAESVNNINAPESDSLLFTTDYGLTVFKTGYMYYFEKLLKNSGYNFTWQNTYNTIPHILKGDFIYE